MENNYLENEQRLWQECVVAYTANALRTKPDMDDDNLYLSAIIYADNIIDGYKARYKPQQ